MIESLHMSFDRELFSNGFPMICVDSIKEFARLIFGKSLVKTIKQLDSNKRYLSLIGSMTCNL